MPKFTHKKGKYSNAVQFNTLLGKTGEALLEIKYNLIGQGQKFDF